MSELDEVMKKLRAQGIEVSVNRAPGAAFRDPSPADEIAKSAKKAGIYYEQEDDDG